MTLKITSLLLLALYLPSLAQIPNCAHDAKTFRCVKYLKNYDGDTITVDIPDTHPLIGKNISVRVNGIDTPEKTGKKPCEKERAREAQKLTASLLKPALNIELRNLDRDKYFRILADVFFDNKPLSETLIKN